MSLAAVLLLGTALGTDAFSACLGIGFMGISRGRAFSLVLTVTLLHVLMPLLGWWLGSAVGAVLGRLAGIMGAVVLFFFGIRMVIGGFRAADPGSACVVPVGRLGVLILGASVSMDALSVGFALGVYYLYSPFLVAGIFGLVAGVMTALGLWFGRTVGNWVGRRAQVLGGLILLGVGLHLLC
ncbi:MAG TPA: manganese efflux pump [Desulfotomaculum sp.]|nr:manganese efflux pump [Desulfotomaculum sp.]